MLTLYHLWLSGPCRAVRIVLAEKGRDVALRLEEPWLKKPDFIALNAAGEVPVLKESDGPALAGATVICEYLDECFPDPPIIGEKPAERAEVRRLGDWFLRKFESEVSRNLIEEKIIKRFDKESPPDSRVIREGKKKLRYHLDYIGYLVERRRWLGGDAYSLADIAAAAQLSCIDYLGDVPWDDFEAAKDWYARIKSRPSFRPLLADQIPNLAPPAHYRDLDF